MFECLSAASLSTVLFPNGRNRVAVRKSDTWQRFHSTIQHFRTSPGFNTGSDNDTDSDSDSESDDIDIDSGTDSESDDTDIDRDIDSESDDIDSDSDSK